MLLLGAAPAFAQVAFASTASTSTALGREAVALLAGRASDPDPEVRAAVASSWGELGNRAAIAVLKKALQDPSPDVRIAAAVSLRRLGDVQGLLALIDETKAFKSGPSASPAEELRKMARDAARARAVLKLGQEGGDSGREALEASLRDSSGAVRDAAAVALARLGRSDAAQFLEALKDPDEGVRSSAAKSLGLIGRGGLDALKKALSL